MCKKKVLLPASAHGSVGKSYIHVIYIVLQFWVQVLSIATHFFPKLNVKEFFLTACLHGSVCYCVCVAGILSLSPECNTANLL